MAGGLAVDELKFKFSIFDGPGTRLHDQKACRLDVGALLVDVVVASHIGWCSCSSASSIPLGGKRNANGQRERESVLLKGQWLTQMDSMSSSVESKCAAGRAVTANLTRGVGTTRVRIQQASPSLAASFAMLSPGPTVCDSKQTNLDGTVSWAGGQRKLPQA